MKLRANKDKRSLRRNLSLTESVRMQVDADMRSRYQSAWQLDDAFLPLQVESLTNKSKNDMDAPRPFKSRYSTNTEHPIAPWGFIIAWAMAALSLGTILIITATGGLDLG